jgi:RNA polymerase sigma-70 factor (ECF subfamily)
MIQDTFMRTMRNLENFEPRNDGAFGGYLRQALNNRIRDEMRKVHGRPGRDALGEDHRDEGASPLEEAIGAEALERYENALRSLSDDDRALVLARIEMGLSYDEVATATGKPTSDAARMAVGRALIRLAKGMDHA